MKRRRGSVLIMALWIISVLAVMVMSFAFEARQQSGINVYIRERNRVNRLIEPGRILGEVIMLGFKDVKDPEIKNGEADWKDVFEDEDRWCKEKYALKHDTRCTVGPVLLDEEDPDSGTVTIDIELVNSGSENGININNLYDGGDSDYISRWQQILLSSGIPTDLEVEVKEADGRTTKRRNLMNHLIACWNDWRGAKATSSKGPITDDPDIESQEGDGAGVGRTGGNGEYYREYYEQLVDEAHGKEEREQVKAEAYYPKEGEAREIPDIKELEYVRGFRDFPSVLTGGRLYDNTEYADKFDKAKDKDSLENPTLTGIADLLGVSGSSKIVINDKTTVRQLLTVPGISQNSGNEEDDKEDGEMLAKAILDTLYSEPEDADDRVAATAEDGRKWWPYKDWQDLNTRLDDNNELDSNVKLGSEAQQLIEWQPSETSVFKMKIVGESMGMKREVNCKCYVKDKAVRYIEWNEN